jgi:hypothetical protein
VELRPIHRNYDGRPVIALTEGQLEVVGLGVAGHLRREPPATPILNMSDDGH